MTNQEPWSHRDVLSKPILCFVSKRKLNCPSERSNQPKLYFRPPIFHARRSRTLFDFFLPRKPQFLPASASLYLPTHSDSFLRFQRALWAICGGPDRSGQGGLVEACGDGATAGRDSAERVPMCARTCNVSTGERNRLRKTPYEFTNAFSCTSTEAEHRHVTALLQLPLSSTVCLSL